MPPPLLKEVELVKKRDRKSLSFELKREILERAERGVQRSEICKEFGLADSTVRHILKVADKIKHHFAQTKLPKVRYSARASLLEELDKELFKFIENQKLTNNVLTMHAIFNEATRLFNELKHIHKGPKNFNPTKTWYIQFESRANARNIYIPIKGGSTNTAKVSSDENDDYISSDELMLSEDIETSVPKESNNFDSCEVIQTVSQNHESKKLTEKVIEQALNHIESAFELLEKHDTNWERVSSLRRNIDDAVSSYKEILIQSRGTPKQNAIYDLLKNVSRKPELMENQMDDELK